MDVVLQRSEQVHLAEHGSPCGDGILAGLGPPGVLREFVLVNLLLGQQHVYDAPRLRIKEAALLQIGELRQARIAAQELLGRESSLAQQHDVRHQYLAENRLRSTIME